MSTAEIIAPLPRLNAAKLAQVRAKLRELAELKVNAVQTAHVYSPRFAWLEQAKEFVKQIADVAPDAAL